MALQTGIEKIASDLFKQRCEERFYKQCYERYPFDDFALFEDWEQFRAEYIKRCKKQSQSLDFDMPYAPPTPMPNLLTEERWFDSGHIVRAFPHARYGPAFLHQLEFINIMYVMHGTCTIYDESGVIEKLSAGNLCVILPKIRHAVFCCHDDDVVINIITKRTTFETAFFSVLSEQNIVSNFFWNMLYCSDENRMMFVKGAKNEVVKNTVLSLYDEVCNATPPSAMMQKSFLCILFGQICRLYEKDIYFLKANTELSKRTSNILRYVIENMREATLERTAEHFNMSCGYLSRCLSSETSVTFQSFLRSVRMERARELLANQSLGIEQIMDAVGYTDHSYFYRSFKKLYGCTPGEYRKGHKKPQ